MENLNEKKKFGKALEINQIMKEKEFEGIKLISPKKNEFYLEKIPNFEFLLGEEKKQNQHLETQLNDAKKEIQFSAEETDYLFHNLKKYINAKFV